MLKSERKFGFYQIHEGWFPDTSETVDSAIHKHAVRCPNDDTCFTWATVYHNISVILDDIEAEKFREIGKWSDENNRPLLCNLEDGVVRTYGFVFLVRKGRRLLEHINDIIVRVVEGGIFTHIMKRTFDKQEAESKFNSATFTDSYTTISISHLQTVFHLLLLGYVLAVACFVTEKLWHRYRSKGCVPNGTFLYHR
jgi:hypothetical protein